MTESILNLSTIVDRPTITLASKKHPTGKLYECVGLADLGPYEHAIILDRDAKVRPLFAKKRLTAAQKLQLEKALNDTVKLIVPSLEPATLKELTSAQKQNIVIAWSLHVSPRAAEGNAQSRRTTAASSPGSKRSTAATRKRGSTRRRTS